VPEGTARLVLLVDDPDAPIEGSFVHWVLCNLHPDRQGIAEGEDRPRRALGPTALAGRATWGQRRRPVMTRIATSSGCSPSTSRSR